MLNNILQDPEATDNDRFVAYNLLQNAVVAAEGQLPSCQDTGTAIVMAKKGENVFTGVDDAEYLSKGIFNTYQERNLRYSQIVPISITQTYLDENGKKATKTYTVSSDEGPRADTGLDALAKLKPVFADNGSVTAGNSSQMSDGAAFVLVMSEEMVKELNLEPLARLVNFASAGVAPRVMGIGPIKAIPKALQQAGLQLNQIELIELNEAFASQSLAVIRSLGLNPDIVNVNGGAIALGHPLGCTGAKLSVQLFDEMKRRGNKYGLVSMCVGTGQGSAGVFEVF
jgi:acetyl-CoA acyltransferase